MRKQWEVMPGRGATIIDALGEAARQWDTARQSLAELEKLAEEFGPSSDEVLSLIEGYVFNKATSGPKVADAVDLLTPTARRKLLLGFVGNHLGGVAESRKASQIFRDSHQRRRARITALASGMVTQTTIHYGWNVSYEPRPLEAGESLLAKSFKLWTEPEHGGLLDVIDTGMGSGISLYYVTGLVAPETGTPQVELEIMAKS